MTGISVHETDSAGYLPLHYACAGGHSDIVQIIAEFGGDVTSYLTGYSPTEIAARNGHDHVIQILLQFGANVNDTGIGEFYLL